MALLYRLKPGPLPLSDLAGALNVTPRNVTGLVDHLERDGMVERVPDEEDRRSTLARLTPAGEAKLEEIAGEMRRVRETIVKEFSDEELELLRHLCLKVVRNLTEWREE
jgi:DNA-binding MarR family transcriptional regulator